MNVLLATAGSRGDVQPMLALAVGLRHRGHDVRLCGPTDARDAVEAQGVRFADSGIDSRRFLDEHPEFVEGRPRALLTAKRYANALLDAQFQTLEREAAGADLIVGAGLVSAPSSIAEAMRVPYRFVAFTSIAIPSRLHPPYLFPVMGLPGIANAALWRLCDTAVRLLIADSMNRNRARLRLAPMRRASRLLTAPGTILLAADPELSPPPFDYDPALVVTGPLRLSPPPGASLPPALEAFLSAGSRPVYIGFGSMTDVDPMRTTRLLVEAVERAGVRAVLGSGWAALGGALPASCYLAGDVPHDLLFPQVAAVVHHGGAGTVATAARAGVPQFLVPHTMDQFYWAARVTAAGIAPRATPRRSLDAGRLARSLTMLIEDAAMRKEAAALGERLRGRDGVAEAVRALELAHAR